MCPTYIPVVNTVRHPAASIGFGFDRNARGGILLYILLYVVMCATDMHSLIKGNLLACLASTYKSNSRKNSKNFIAPSL